jgi:hypothetical protein
MFRTASTVRRSLAATAVAALTLIASVATIQPAAADAPLVLCTGQATTNYSPGLHVLVPRDVTFIADIDYGNCPTGDGVTSAVYHEAGVLENATCTAVPSTETATITWRNGSTVVGTSTVDVTGVELNATGLVQVYTSLGTVTSGRYAGKTVNIVVTLLVDLDNPTPCLTPAGLTHLSGLSTLTIV